MSSKPQRWPRSLRLGGGSPDPASIFHSSANEVGDVVIDIQSFAPVLSPKILASSSIATMSRKISAQEVAKHCNIDDCWIVVNGKVYDLTKFAPNHPGGPESMLNVFFVIRESSVNPHLSGIPMGWQGWHKNIQHVSLRNPD